MHLTPNQLEGLQMIWNYYDLFQPETYIGAAENAMHSILYKVGKNLKNKLLKLQIKGSDKKKIKITLEVYEAVYLEIYIRGILMHMNFGYERSTAVKVAAEINQLLA